LKCGRYGKYTPSDPVCRDVCVLRTSCKVTTERTCPKCSAEMQLRAGVVLVCPMCDATKKVDEKKEVR